MQGEEGREGGREGRRKGGKEEGREGGREGRRERDHKLMNKSTAQSWGKGCYTVPTSVSYWNTNSGTSIWSGLMVS